MGLLIFNACEISPQNKKEKLIPEGLVGIFTVSDSNNRTG